MTLPAGCNVRATNWTRDRERIEKVRRSVFIVEQSVSEDQEWDVADETCVHVLAESDGGETLGTGRLESNGKIGRMAVFFEHRNRGIGDAILVTLIGLAEERSLDQVHLHAQTQAQPFYARHGFRPEGDVFDEAGIPHRLMRRVLEKT